MRRGLHRRSKIKQDYFRFKAPPPPPISFPVNFYSNILKEMETGVPRRRTCLRFEVPPGLLPRCPSQAQSLFPPIWPYFSNAKVLPNLFLSDSNSESAKLLSDIWATSLQYIDMYEYSHKNLKSAILFHKS
jgi:hypothetical protein